MEAKLQDQQSMLDLIRALAQARVDHVNLSEEYDIAYRAFKEAHKELRESKEVAASRAAVLDSLVRTRAAEAYEANPNIGKKPFPGIGIRVSIHADVDFDPKTALDWAKKHDMCLALDSKAFSTLCANESTRPDFVTFEESEIVTVTITTDLSQAIAEVH
jgi:hypothetical protein